MTPPCPLFEQEKIKTDVELASKYDKQNADLYQYLSRETGQNITTLLDVETLYNTLEIEVGYSQLSMFNFMFCSFETLD